MSKRSVGYLFVVFATLTACSNTDFYEAIQAAHSWNESPSEGEGNSVSGYWHQENSAEGYDSYLIVETSGDGYLCNEDGKSQAIFSVTLDSPNEATMGQYGYGGGDVLSVDSTGNILTRTGKDHNETYVVAYSRVNALPDWCQAQIDEMTK
jgi:hypothetical protein